REEIAKIWGRASAEWGTECATLRRRGDPGGSHVVSGVPDDSLRARARPCVPRGRFYAALDEPVEWRVAVVRARAGAGKTEGLRDWSRGRPGVVHVILEPHHDGPM